MKLSSMTVWIFGLLVVCNKGVASEWSAEEILAKADEVRNPAQSYEMKVSVESGKSSPNKTEFEVFIQGNQRTLIRTLSPVRDRGRNLLMIDESMWAFIPNLSRAVRVSLSQRLTGQAANGDISRLRWSGDYNATLESETQSGWVLLLSAKKKGLTYEKIRVWIEKEKFFPKQAEYLTLSGKPLKVAFYEDYKVLAGRVRPGKIRITDSVRSDEVSTIEITKMDVKTFPSSLFNQNALK